MIFGRILMTAVVCGSIYKLLALTDTPYRYAVN